ncbi:F-box domain containing protein [Pandoravirus salinus]|uniref:F-box domain containing protein n=1 Tax=Pandoravirus salinus TaxID=1349410 RepID=S4VZ96_9VIRU|nr:F-box domain [Pandoravirus salinus]AGO84831.1 F-box domain containing protein [Pandoravirus salinus]
MQDHNSVADMTALPNEILAIIMGMCAPRNLCRLAAVSSALRRLALDERLWKLHYKRAVGRCYGVPGGCLARGGNQLGDVDPFACIIATADRLLDIKSPIVDASDPYRAMRHLCRSVPQQSCRHHWPSVIRARGYRWAYAVAKVKRPRWFGPHLDGSPASLVGRVERGGHLCCGDFVRIRGKYKPHGYATCDGMSHKCDCGSTHHVVRKVSGIWSHGVPTGPVVGWMPLQKGDAYSRSGSSCLCRGWSESYVGCLDDCALFLHGGYGSHGLEGLGVVVGSKTMRACQWVRGQPTDVVTIHKSSGQQACADGRSDSRVRGTLRVHGLLGFCGTIESEDTPREGDFFGTHGNVLFRGDLDAGKGRIYADDGLVLKCNKWNREWRRDRQDRGDPGKAPISVYYANGDKAVWARTGQQPVLVRFVAGGTSYEPILGWHVVMLPDASTPEAADDSRDQSQGRRLVIDQDWVWSSSACRDQIRWPDRVVDLNLVFWPRINSTRFIDDVLRFVNHMVSNHDAQLWTRCLKAVRAFYGLD